MQIEIKANGTGSLIRKDGIRTNKGKSILAFPNDYTVIDIETTGLSSEWDEIIELCAVRVRNNFIVDTFSELVKPSMEIDSFIEKLTGITNQDLSTARSIENVLPDYLNFIGDEIIIGHNVNFDINFIYDSSMSINKVPFQNDFVDTLRLSRKHVKELQSHRLDSLVEYYGIEPRKEHRGLSDAILCQSIYCKIYDAVEDKEAFINSFKNKNGASIILRAKDVIATDYDFDDTHPLYEKVCVFTGALEKMTRKEAMQLVVNVGGVNGDGVTKETNFLILGNNDYCSSIKDGKSNKHKRAEKLILEGYDLIIIPENVFYDMVGL